MNRKFEVLVVIAITTVALFTLSAFATDAQMYFSLDKNGQNRVTNIQEGDEIWIVVIDNDENTDCDVRDKIWTDIKLMDPKTGAYIVWISYFNNSGDASGVLYDATGHVPYKGHYPGTPGSTSYDYLEETGADTGVFVSKRAFQVGTREDYSQEYKNTHVVDTASSPPDDFKWGAYLYSDIEQESVPPKLVPGVAGDMQRWIGATGTGSPLAYQIGFVDAEFGNYELPSQLVTTRGISPEKWLVGRFENMDTLVGMYQDPNDLGDVAIGLMKIIDVEAQISWDQEIYDDGNETATITVEDADENLNCNQVEYVPVFIIVNPGSWNPAGTSAVEASQTNDSPNNFCMLKRTGGVDASKSDPTSNVTPYRPIRWFNIYNSEKNDFGTSGAKDGRYYMQYPKLGGIGIDIATNKTLFDTISDSGITAVSFYAQETGANTGVFQLNLNSILVDLGFNSLNARDVLVAYYLDPNDEDDFKLATAYIEERQHSLASFTDASQYDQNVYWIGHDAVYVQVVDTNANVDSCCPEKMIVHVCDPHGEDDGEFWVLHETSSNSPVFFSTFGMELLATWDALGVGISGMIGGYQLVLDNWKLEVFNEDEVYVRYNDVQYMAGNNGYGGLADSSTITAYSGPRIDAVRLASDVSFDLMSIADTQVYDGMTVNMFFLDRQGNRVSGYVNSDCVFVEVIDPDQDEDQYRRERVEAYWDGGQNYPFGPVPRNEFGCVYDRALRHPVNDLLGDTNIFNDSPNPYNDREDGAAKIYVLNPRNGRWAATDLLETGTASGVFVSVMCIDLAHVYECVPALGVLPGDTIIAVYQDPSNHSDSAWISIKVGIGGGGTPPSQQSTTMFVDANGDEVAAYTDADLVYVKVIDPSHAGATLLASALDIDGVTYDLSVVDGQADGFMTEGLGLQLTAGGQLTATYTDPTDLMDTSADTITIISSVLVVDSFYAGPNPFDAEVTFGFNGTGIAMTMSVAVYDLAGGLVWETAQTDVSEITWDGAGLAKGAYIYVITATDGTNTFSDTGKVFVNR